MKTYALWLAGIAAGALVWFSANELAWPARLLTALLLGPAPVAFLLQAHLADQLDGELPRLPLYILTIAGLLLLGSASLVAGGLSGFTARLMGLLPIRNSVLMVWTLFAILAIAAVVAAFKASGFRESALMRAITPVSRIEKVVFTALSVIAGVCEELSFRSFLIPALMVVTGSRFGSVAISSAAFGVLHAHQRTGGALRAGMLGVVLSIPFLITGSVYPSMAAHALVDMVGGLWVARWLFDDPNHT
jgi:membrane protease YdiL (CAAX protease family)